jgi:dTDP-glucose 4,6-dehydratase
MTVLLTGVSGFVGHHIFEHIMKMTDWEVVGMHRSGFAGDLGRLDEVLARGPGEWRDRLTLIHHDLRDPIHEPLPDARYIVHVAASSHVDRSIADPRSFVYDNVLGTLNMLEYARSQVIQKFIYFSTDEVYGNAADGVYPNETFPHRPRNPYAATKASAEDICYSYLITYRVPLIVTNTMNIIGERQHTEKYVPIILRSLLRDETLYIHAHPDKKRPGQRHYLHAANAADALLFVLRNGEVGERYNIVGEKEIDNLELAQEVTDHFNEWGKKMRFAYWRPKTLKYELVDFQESRPGHDLRYALDGSKLAAMGYKFPTNFDESLKKTVFWTLDHMDRWL